MAKKPVQFRFDENFHKALFEASVETGQSVSDIVRQAIGLYLSIHERTKNKKARFFIQYEDDKLCEVILPWLN